MERSRSCGALQYCRRWSSAPGRLGFPTSWSTTLEMGHQRVAMRVKTSAVRISSSPFASFTVSTNGRGGVHCVKSSDVEIITRWPGLSSLFLPLDQIA